MEKSSDDDGHQRGSPRVESAFYPPIVVFILYLKLSNCRLHEANYQERDLVNRQEILLW